MKKLLVLVIVFSICIFPFSNAYAAPTAYAVNEENMTVTIPDGWDVFTQDTDEKDARLSEYGLDGSFISDMKSKNVTLEALYQKPRVEIYVACISNDSSETIYNLKTLNDSNTEMLAKSLLSRFESGSEIKVVVDGYKIYTNNRAKYIVCNYTYVFNGTKAYGVQYYTMINGQTICIVLLSYNEPISDQMADTIKSTVDSLMFTENPNPHPDKLASMQAEADATATNQASAKPTVVASAEPSAAVSSEPEASTLPVMGDAASKKPDAALLILIVLGGGVVVALIIAGIVRFAKKRGGSQYDSREIVISSDAYNADTPDNSGGFIPPEPTERSGPWNTDVAGEGQAAQPEETQETKETDGGYQPQETQEACQSDETGKTDAADQPDATGETDADHTHTTGDEVFCNQCGAKVPENSRFCYRCGAPIHRD